MSLAIIGSVALNAQLNYEYRKPVDFDMVATYDDFIKYVDFTKKHEEILACYPINAGKSYVLKTEKGITECEVAWPNSSAEKLLKIILEDDKTIRIPNNYYASLDVLYLLKMSHRYLKNSPHFLKTMKDVRFLREKGATIRSEHEEYFKEREKDTYSYKHPKLNRNKEDFFSGDGIDYEWDHDSIHQAVKHLEKPAYQYFSGGEVWSDMKKFVTLPENIKLLAVLEESLTLACERSQLAFPDAIINPKWSFDMALFKVASSITSGVFREYAWENYDRVQGLYQQIGWDYMDRVRAGIDSGIVKKLKEN